MLNDVYPVSAASNNPFCTNFNAWWRKSVSALAVLMRLYATAFFDTSTPAALLVKYHFQRRCFIDTTTTPQPFMAIFPGPSGWASARRELRDVMMQGKINRGRHTDHPAGHHSIRTKQCPPPPSPIFYSLDAIPAAQPTVSKHWRQVLQTLSTVN